MVWSAYYTQKAPFLTSLSLKAYGLKLQWGPGDGKPIISWEVLLRGTCPQGRGRARATRGHWLLHSSTARSLTAKHTIDYAKHIPAQIVILFLCYVSTVLNFELPWQGRCGKRYNFQFYPRSRAISSLLYHTIDINVTSEVTPLIWFRLDVTSVTARAGNKPFWFTTSKMSAPARTEQNTTTARIEAVENWPQAVLYEGKPHLQFQQIKGILQCNHTKLP